MRKNGLYQSCMQRERARKDRRLEKKGEERRGRTRDEMRRERALEIHVLMESFCVEELCSEMHNEKFDLRKHR